MITGSGFQAGADSSVSVCYAKLGKRFAGAGDFNLFVSNEPAECRPDRRKELFNLGFGPFGHQLDPAIGQVLDRADDREPSRNPATFGPESDPLNSPFVANPSAAHAAQSQPGSHSRSSPGSSPGRFPSLSDRRYRVQTPAQKFEDHSRHMDGRKDTMIGQAKFVGLAQELMGRLALLLDFQVDCPPTGDG